MIRSDRGKRPGDASRPSLEGQPRRQTSTGTIQIKVAGSPLTQEPGSETDKPQRTGLLGRKPRNKDLATPEAVRAKRTLLIIQQRRAWEKDAGRAMSLQERSAFNRNAGLR